MASRNEIKDLKTLNVAAIRDYHVCSLFYKYRYEDELYEPIPYAKLNQDRFHNTLVRVMSYFFYKKQSGVKSSYTSLVNRWEKLWFPEDMDAYDMAIERHEIGTNNLASYSNIAIAALKSFHSEFKNDKGIPVLIKEDYLVPLRHNLRLSGTIDLVLKYPNGSNRVISWLKKSNNANANFMSMEFAAMRFAFEHSLGRDKNVTYHLYDAASATRGFIDLPQPSKADLKSLLFWADEVSKAEHFTPRRGFTAYCKGCPFDAECKEFSSWPIDL